MHEIFGVARAIYFDGTFLSTFLVSKHFLPTLPPERAGPRYLSIMCILVQLFQEDIFRDLQVADKEWRICLLRYFNPVRPPARPPLTVRHRISRLAHIAADLLASQQVQGTAGAPMHKRADSVLHLHNSSLWTPSRLPNWAPSENRMSPPRAALSHSGLGTAALQPQRCRTEDPLTSDDSIPNHSVEVSGPFGTCGTLLAWREVLLWTRAPSCAVLEPSALPSFRTQVELIDQLTD